MPTISIRRLGVALLAAAVVFTTGTAFAANLNLTAPSAVGAGQATITAPCTGGVVATYTIAYRSTGNAYYVDTVHLAGTGCTGTNLTVQVTLNDGGTDTSTDVTDVLGSTINTSGLDVNVSGKNVMASAAQGVVVVIAGS
jgi:hypothetical protein